MNQVSPSAKGVAYLRHLELEVSRDTLAEYFCDDEGRKMAKKWLGMVGYVGRAVAIRGRYIEDRVADYIEKKGIKQVLNIPAGLNTFPYRHESASRLDRYAELDLPDMINFKKGKIEQLRNEEKVNNQQIEVDYIPIDLSLDSFAEDFENIDWDWNQPSIYIFEGMSYYLPLDKLAQIISIFSKTMAKGSVFIMDYLPDYVKNDLDPLMQTIIDAGGEACLTYLSEPEVANLLRNFNIISDRLESDLEKEYYRDHICRPIGSIVIAERR